eukprot:TRINITY_DN863_c0_g1_i1.p1 TRINITY_DN863_c0_g1~~TRINITY_DN863_c0_g1_i1.p1  ORF type:complete len:311 (-),score=55.93 TRINITY_DN863_c0_g1_i1:53-985(-)
MGNTTAVPEQTTAKTEKQEFILTTFKEDDVLKALETDIKIEDNLNSLMYDVCKSLQENSYACIALNKRHNGILSQLQSSSHSFFALDQDIKDENCDPKKENLGYIRVDGINEYLKLRITGDRRGNWPRFPEGYKQIYEETSDLFQKLSWKIYTSAITYVKLAEEKAGRKFPPFDHIGGIKEAVTELSSVSCIHYFEQPEPTTDPKTGVKPNLVDVCSEHKDTGLLTFILCSKDKQPGLQIKLPKTKEWIKVENLVEYPEDCDNVIFVIVGEKFATFTSADYEFWNPTVHQVFVPPKTERSSILYFMDVSP